MNARVWSMAYLLAVAAQTHAEYVWDPIGPNGGLVAALEALPSQPQIMICGLHNGGAFRSADGGDSWAPLSRIPSGARVADIAIGSFEQAWQVYLSCSSGLFRSDDLGQTWANIGDPVSALEAAQNGIVLARSHYNIWRLSCDSGESWRELEQRPDAATLSPDGTSIYMVNDDDLWRTGVDHLRWEQVSEDGHVWGGGGTATGIEVSPAAPDQLFVPGYAFGDGLHLDIRWKGVKRSIDGGRTWESIGGGFITALEIAGSNGDAFVGNSVGQVFRWRDGGESWDGLGQFGSDVRCIDAERWQEGILTVGTLSGIHQTVDGGETWTRKDRGIRKTATTSVTYLAGRDGGSWLLTTAFDGAFTRSGTGEAWVRLNDAPSASVGEVAVAPSDPSIVYVGAHRSGDGGRSWQALDCMGNLPAGSLAVNPIDPDHVIALFFVDGADYVDWFSLESRDGGKTCDVGSRVHPPPHRLVFDPAGREVYLLRSTYDAPPYGIVAVDLAGNSQRVLHDDYYFDTMVFSPSPPERIYAVEATAEVRRLWRSDDGADTWEVFDIGKMKEAWSTQGYPFPGRLPGYFPAPSGPSPGSLTMDPHNQDRLFYACYGNGVFVSEDAGETWQEINGGLTGLDVHTVAISPSHPSEVLLATFSGIYQLSDHDTAAVDESAELPDAFALAQNSPNPFNSFTAITFALPASSRPMHIELSIYDLLGRRVRTLMWGLAEAGTHEASWDGKDQAGREMSSGVYLYELATDRGPWGETRKMVLIR